MKQRSKRLTIFFGLPLLFLALNYPWTSAALAWVSNAEPCPTALINTAKKRLIPLFGSIKANPIIHCQPATIKGAPGMVNFAPFLPEMLTLRHHGLNEDVIAHEYVHVELSRRLGFFPRFLHIPTWFDEGLAMQADHRPDYSETALKKYLAAKRIRNNTLDHIAKASGFFHKGKQGKYHYALSRCVVQKWLQDQNGQQPLDLIKTIGWFARFPKALFTPYQQACMTAL